MARRKAKKKSGCALPLIIFMAFFGLFGGAGDDDIATDIAQATSQPTQAVVATTTAETTTQIGVPVSYSTVPPTATPTKKPIASPTATATSRMTASPKPVDSSFEIHFIDVGQADSALVMCDGKAMLIDGGNASDSSKLYAYLKSHGVMHLDYVIATHAHEDHVGGIAGALNYASVSKVYCPVTTYSSDAFNNFVKAAKKHGVSITVPKVGTSFSLGSATCTILGVNTSSDVNNTSIVMRITYGETSFLFTGDAEREVEQVLLNRGITLDSTVLKVGHHGSDTSTSYVWLREIMPEYAVVSVGADNSYGHPTEAVLSRLRDAGVKVFRTDMQGHIICVSDGKNVKVTVSRNADADTLSGIGYNSVQKKASSGLSQQEAYYILNTNTKKFHKVGCKSVNQMKEKNKKDHYGTREEAIDMGYSPCGNCRP